MDCLFQGAGLECKVTKAKNSKAIVCVCACVWTQTVSVSETCLWQGVAGDEAGEKDRGYIPWGLMDQHSWLAFSCRPWGTCERF